MKKLKIIPEKRSVLLINPASEFLIDQRVFMPLGIAQIASIAKNNGFDVDFMDMSDKSNNLEMLIKKIKQSEYGYIGITSTSPQFHNAYNILKAIRKEKINSKVILGGAHGSMLHSLREKYLEKGLNEKMYEDEPNFSPIEEFDVIASGEEDSFLKAIESQEKWVDGGVTEKLDELPFPAREIFNISDYLYDLEGFPKFKINGKPTGSIISQRGCPFGCEFCCGRESVMYRKVKLSNGILRVYSPERVIKELDDMNKKWGLESFMFYDDEFNLYPERTKKLCEMLSKKNYQFRGFLRSSLLIKNPEIAAYMKKAGFKEVLVGIETGSNRILKNHLSKGTTAEMNYHALEICMENDLKFKALTMLGHPSETEKDIIDTRNWILTAGKKYLEKKGEDSFTFDLTIFQPYIGSKIWNNSERNKDKHFDKFNWVYFTKNNLGKIIEPEMGGLYLNKVDFSKENSSFYKGKSKTYKAFIRTKDIDENKYVELRDNMEWEIKKELRIPLNK